VEANDGTRASGEAQRPILPPVLSRSLFSPLTKKYAASTEACVWLSNSLSL